MHGWPWYVIILFLWLALRNKRLHTPPHSYTMLHRNGGLEICGEIMRNNPRDWDAMAQSILERFGLNLCAETAYAQL